MISQVFLEVGDEIRSNLFFPPRKVHVHSALQFVNLVTLCEVIFKMACVFLHCNAGMTSYTDWGVMHIPMHT